ncbi:bifunctional fucokinase/fucose-1-phosphate guanylyltransferase [uncultured Duncaniella sp.]|uniref:bifunctional fucokinase/fucose-1-phosphate guanylyltransferase n=1 Tax=uncultured Duncaniella sp. TaxID=2768039 RepID=UPI0025E28BCA|nr:bifunctional fucokinase/fucose-1-phosphate guanylyltransferase [uncultured Duncaniella sp.]
MAKKLLSLPPNLVGCFHDITGLSKSEFYCTSDPIGHRLGSGGGTTWILEECHRESADSDSFEKWIGKERKIIIHAGGQSRRLPSYAPSGKVLTPIPIFRWERGQSLSQTLLDLQLPLYERIMSTAPATVNTMIVSGDVYIRAAERLAPVPKADVVCYGLWLNSSIAKNHGVFYSTHDAPSVLNRMLQKPSVEKLNSLLQTGYFLTDIGIWLLSDRAVELLRKRSRNADGSFKEYDLYSEFGRALGTDPEIIDPELRELSVAIVPLPGGQFYHFGTGREMISSTLAVQNIVNDQREIMHRDRKPHPSIFVQNTITEIQFEASNTNIWIENSHISKGWTLTSDHIITGVPANDWQLSLSPGQCVDIIPVNDEDYAVRVYNIDDRFAGDEQKRPQFPIVTDIAEMGRIVKAMLEGNADLTGYEMLSAERISDIARLDRLVAQRRTFRKQNRIALAENHNHSVFYQTDLLEAAKAFATDPIPLPAPIAETEPLVKRASDAMFRAEVKRRSNQEWKADQDTAFSILREGLTRSALEKKQLPRRAVCSDQIVWSRSPVRIDIAGGWSDTAPYCLMEGGTVINFAIELNGQPPLQAYVRPCKEPHIICRSIDLGAEERIDNFDAILDFHRVGSPFSIPKAALALAGFHPRFCEVTYPSLKAQLEDFGSGLEITLFSAIPAGSGLGTSSILAATVLGAISDFCSLAWDKNEICSRTLVLEQLLTTGGGWQDQFGGVIGGVKLLQTTKGFEQNPMVSWLPDTLFTDPEYASCHLLYYTGITRTAKDILAEIVRNMFLNEGAQLRLLRSMKAHTMEMYDAIMRCNFNRLGELVRTTWNQKMAIDRGTNPPEVDAITRRIDDLCLGYKLPGAGGGGYLYMIAKDPEAAARIRQLLHTEPLRPNARLVDLSLSRSGLTVTRS